MKLRLAVQTEGANKGKILEIPMAQFVIGRDPQCHLRPASPLISKRHCAIIKRDGKAFLSDFGSTNGSFVNEQPVKGEIELKDGDQLKIGPLHFEVKLEADASPEKSTPPSPSKTPSTIAKGPSLAVKPAKPAQVKSSAAEDDEIAALLMGDDPVGGPIPEKVPDGSTVMDLAAMKAPDEKSKEGTPPQGGDANKPADNKAKAPGTGDTRSAADAILKKYMKRPRN